MNISKNKKILLILTLALVCIVIGIGVSHHWFKSNESFTLIKEAERKAGPCPGPMQVIKTPDGKSYQYLPNYYSCNAVKRGDLVYLRFSSQLLPVVRIVYGIPGDLFELKADDENENWNLKINNKLVLDPDKKVHFFGGNAPPVLSLYEKSFRHKLSAQNFIVFSENSPGDQDSSRLGVVNVDDFIGKIEAMPETKKRPTLEAD